MNERLKRVIIVIVAIILALLIVLFFENKKHPQTENKVEVEENVAEEIMEPETTNVLPSDDEKIEVKKVEKVKNVIPQKQNQQKAATKPKTSQNIIKSEDTTPIDMSSEDVSLLLPGKEEPAKVVDVTKEYKLKGQKVINFQGVNYIVKHRNKTQEQTNEQ